MGKWNQKMLREGRCVNCGKERSSDSKRYCDRCLEVHARQSRNWAKNNPDKIRASNKVYSKKWREEHNDKYQDQKVRWNDRTRKTAVNHRKRWSSQEEEWLWKNQHLSRRELCETLGRTIVAIFDRLYLLKESRERDEDH